MSLKLAETSVVKSRPPVTYGANLLPFPFNFEKNIVTVGRVIMNLLLGDCHINLSLHLILEFLDAFFLSDISWWGNEV